MSKKDFGKFVFSQKYVFLSKFILFHPHLEEKHIKQVSYADS